MTEIKSYRDLRVWQEAMELAAAAYRFTPSLPNDERYGLTSQIRRAASSIPANVAEGYGRESAGSYVQFLKTSRGSLYELETHVRLSEKIGFRSAEQTQPLLQMAGGLGRMLSNLIRSVQASARANSSD